MMFIDTHAHLYLEEFDADQEAMVQRAQDAGIARVFLPNIDGSTIPALLAFEERYPFARAMMGLHPCSVNDQVDEALLVVEEWLQKRTFAAVGEIGLDFHWDTTYRKQQIHAFERQIDWAKSLDLPIVIHSRKAMRECIDIVRSRQDGRLRGVFHCFTGSAAEAEEITSLGFSLGIGGVVTFKKSGLDAVIAAVGLGPLVLETDAPYLAPVPYRGKRNESSYIPLIAEKIAAILGSTAEEVAAATSKRASTLFREEFTKK